LKINTETLLNIVQLLLVFVIYQKSQNKNIVLEKKLSEKVFGPSKSQCPKLSQIVSCTLDRTKNIKEKCRVDFTKSFDAKTEYQTFFSSFSNFWCLANEFETNSKVVGFNLVVFIYY
jgi:hypothetical protein